MQFQIRHEFNDCPKQQFSKTGKRNHLVGSIFHTWRHNVYAFTYNNNNKKREVFFFPFNSEAFDKWSCV